MIKFSIVPESAQQNMSEIDIIDVDPLSSISSVGVPDGSVLLSMALVEINPMSGEVVIAAVCLVFSGRNDDNVTNTTPRNVVNVRKH